MNNERRWAVVGFLVAIGLALLAMSSIVASPGELYPGAFISDSHTKIWEQWWVSENLGGQGLLPTRCNFVNYPNVGSLFPSGPLLSLIGALLTPIFGLIAAFNLTVFLYIVFGSFGTFLFAWRLTKKPESGLVAMAGFNFSPFFLAYVLGSGVTEMIGAGLVPLGLYFLHRSATEKGWGNTIMAGFALALVMVSAGYAAEMTALLLGVFGIYAIVFGRRNAANCLLVDGEKMQVSWLRPLAALAICGLVSFWPNYLLFTTISAADSMLSSRFEQFTTQGFAEFAPSATSHYIASLVGYFLPGKMGLYAIEETTVFLKVWYPGLFLMLLAFVGVIAVHNRFAYLLAFTAAAFGLMATGPYLNLGGGYALAGPWNPFFLVPYYVFPMFKEFMNPFRLCLWTSMALALLAAGGASYLVSSIKRHRLILAVILFLAIVGETIFISPAPFPTPVSSLKLPAVYQQLASEPAGALAELPVFRQGTLLSHREHFAYQIEHKRPIMDNVTGYLPDYIRKNPFLSQMVFMEKPDEVTPTGNPLEGLAEMREQGFSHLIVNINHYKPDTWKQIKAALLSYGLDLTNEQGGFILIRL